MFQASVDGEAYDPDRFSQYFRPAGMASRTGDPNVAASVNATATSQSAPVAPAPVVEAVATAPVVEAEAPKTENKAEDILAMIRSRQN